MTITIVSDVDIAAPLMPKTGIRKIHNKELIHVPRKARIEAIKGEPEPLTIVVKITKRVKNPFPIARIASASAPGVYADE